MSGRGIPRVAYIDLEAWGGERPAQLSILLVRQPLGEAVLQPDPSDLPAEWLDALRMWLVGAPTALGVEPSNDSTERVGYENDEETEI